MADAAVKRAFFGQGWHEGGVCPGLGDGVGMVLLGRMAWSLAEASAAIGKPSRWELERELESRGLCSSSSRRLGAAGK